jgi:glycosyltransferase involved in cell wall biosynthesis
MQDRTMSASFAVNGRYLTQSISGVQRYARNIVRALDQIPESEGATVISPQGTSHPAYERLQALQTGLSTGYVWEQGELPIAARGRRLLNLCNMAPILKNEQIVCIHDTNVLSSPGSYTRGFRTVYRCLQPLLARRAVQIATVSNASAQELARYLALSPDEIVVLPNGHEHALSWKPDPAALPAELPVHPQDRPFVLAINATAPHKNIRLLIDIAPRLEELGINVVIIGSDHIIRQPKLALPGNVYPLGRVSDDVLAYLLDQALCLAFPSFTEGFGLPLVEAMARGCPVVSSDCASMPEICGNAALLASPFDPAQWVDRISALKASDHLRIELAGRGREQCRTFSWQKSAMGYLELLQNPIRARRLVPRSKPEQLQISAVFATLRRPDVVQRTVKHFLSSQRLAPRSVIVSCATAEDAGDLVHNKAVKIVTGPIGLATQRNTALRHLGPETDIVAFFDDDFVAHPDWLAEAAKLFCDDSQVDGVTGVVLADGIKGPGIPFEEAERIVEADSGSADRQLCQPFSPYGCNMAFRVTSIGDARFDEKLVLYGWLEDRDFGGQLAMRGARLVKWSGCKGVHMGVKSGRTSGERLGYSQVANPVHLMRKGTMAPHLAIGQMGRNIASNMGRFIAPEPYVDRKGRLKGNLLALRDAITGKLAPERALLMGDSKVPMAAKAKPAQVGRT